MTDRPMFTLAEAVRASDRSRSTLQRDLKAGRIDGAHRADPADPASPWVIPADGLVAAGYRLHAPTPDAAAADSDPAPDPSTAVAADLADLRRRAEVAEALATERAATLGGARIPAAGELPARCYVRTQSGLRRLRAMVDRDAPVRCWVRPSPIEWIPLNENHPPDAEHPWAVAHPILCALRLAADPARGREVVEGWGLVPGVGQ